MVNGKGSGAPNPLHYPRHQRVPVDSREGGLSRRVAQVRPRGRGAADPDEATIAVSMVRHMVAKAKDSLLGGPEDRDRS